MVEQLPNRFCKNELFTSHIEAFGNVVAGQLNLAGT